MISNRHSETAAFAVNMFNALFPVGSSVLYVDDGGVIDQRFTQSEAWVSPSGHPVIRFANRSGSFLLTRVRLPNDLVRKTQSACLSANRCDHERLTEDGICRSCGADCRGTEI